MDTLRALFESLIVVAFDSTPCDENSSPLGTELTEMSWLTYDMALHQANNTKQFFVKPDYAPKVLGERPILRSASPLKEVIQQFDNYISSLTKIGKSYCIITDGFWELKQGLREESRTKGIKLGAHLNKFFDIKIEFLRTYPRVQGIDMSLNSMITALGMHPLERSSTLDDCKSMVILIERMNKDGHSFNSPEVLPESFNTAVPPAQSLHSSTVVKLRGLPWEADETAFEDFFKQAELTPVDALVVLNHQNRPSGLGFARFATADEAQRALVCHKRYMGHRFIEVFRCLDADYDRMVAKGHGYKRVVHKQAGTSVVASAGTTVEATQLVVNVPQQQQQEFTVKLRGLPWSSSVADIQRFLEPLLIPAQAIHIQFTADNRPSGEAFVDLTSEEQVQLALKKHREMMGPRYVEVFRTSRRDSSAAQQQTVTPVTATPGMGNVQPRVTTGLMTPGPIGGLVVANTNVPSVALTPVTMVPPQMHVPMTAQPGLVMAQHNPFAAGSVKPETVQPMMNMSNVTGAPGARNFLIKMRGMPWTATEQDIAAFFDPFRVISATTLRDKFDRATGEALVEFENDDVTNKAMSKHKGMMGTRYIELFRVSRAELANPSGPVAPTGGPVPKRERPSQGPNMNKGSGVTLKMRGLPYHATVDDVAEFFKGYNFVRESIRFGTWNDKPSGEAWVTFTTNDEANSALAAKQHDYIGNRYIDLFLV